MRILDKYISKKIIGGYLFVLLVLISLYFIADLFSNLSDILKSKPQLLAIINYYIYMLPLIFLRTSPFSLLISTLYTFGELNKSNEIISIRTSGISVFRIALPVIIFSLIISNFSFFIQEKILLYSQKKLEDIKIRFIKKESKNFQEESNVAFQSKDMIIFVAKFLPKIKVLEDVVIFKEDENANINKKIICKNIIYSNNQWVGHNVIEYNLDIFGKIIEAPIFWKEKKIEIEEKPQELVFKKSIFSQYSSLKNLKKEITRLKKIKAYDKLNNLTIDYYQKFLEPFSHFFLIIGALPFALEVKKRKVALSSLGLGLILGFIYFYLSSISIALGKTGFILPILSSFIAPLFFLSIGLSGLFFIK